MFFILKFNSKKLKNKKIQDTKNQIDIIVDFLENKKSKKEILKNLFSLFSRSYDGTIHSEDLAKFRRENGISKATLWRIMNELESLGIVKSNPHFQKGNFYHLQKDFAKSLYKVGRAYKNLFEEIP